jgi:hypothetical protein
MRYFSISHFYLFQIIIMKIPVAILISFLPFNNFSQVVLKSDGPGNTYELINSVLAPGNEAVEHPECIHGSFGRHIAEVWDDELNENVFEFYSHVTPDNDRCEKIDRQRVEIKTYEPSPANLIGTLGETVTYKWKFRLPKGFQPSSNFTHLHQIKAVGGSQDLPIFTITARKAKVNQLIVIHNNENTVASADLSEFEGTWVEITEKIKIGEKGTYSISIKKIKNGKELLSFKSDNIMTIRSDNDFIRPKWGIYRSLKKAEDLRDEAVRFNDFSIKESE